MMAWRLPLVAAAAAQAPLAAAPARSHPVPPPPPPPPPLPCPCSDASLCKPLAPHRQPAEDADQVVAFSSWEFSGEPYPANWTAPLHFDWSKITAFAPFDNIDRGKFSPDDAGYQSEYEQLFCKAHAHGARILTNGYKNWAGVTCPVNRFYGWAMRKNPIIYNKTAVRGWAAETAAWYRHPVRCF